MLDIPLPSHFLDLPIIPLSLPSYFLILRWILPATTISVVAHFDGFSKIVAVTPMTCGESNIRMLDLLLSCI